VTLGEQQQTDGPSYSLGCIGRENPEFLKLKVDVSKEDELLFLIDTGADVSLLKGNKLVWTTEYDPEGKVKVKCVDESPIETHGVIDTKIDLGKKSATHGFQLVNKQVDIQCDGILGRDFHQRARANIFYETRTVTLNGQKCEMVGKTQTLETKGKKRLKIGQIKLPPRRESIVRIPVAPGSPQVGIVNKRELRKALF
jgi:hypothetical protein